MGGGKPDNEERPTKRPPPETKKEWKRRQDKTQTGGERQREKGKKGKKGSAPVLDLDVLEPLRLGHRRGGDLLLWLVRFVGGGFGGLGGLVLRLVGCVRRKMKGGTCSCWGGLLLVGVLGGLVGWVRVVVVTYIST